MPGTAGRARPQGRLGYSTGVGTEAGLMFLVCGEALYDLFLVDEAGVITCRWHESRFDLSSGEIVHWCEPHGGTPISLIPHREENGHIWLAVD